MMLIVKKIKIKSKNEEFIELIKQSFPEKKPLIYSETKLKLFS